MDRGILAPAGAAITPSVPPASRELMPLAAGHHARRHSALGGCWGHHGAVTVENVTTIFCPPGLRELWRQEGSALPSFWHQHYPQLFDEDDLRIANGPQRLGHFSEWFAAIHLFHRDGSISFIEKYDTYENHRNNRLHRNTHARKIAEYERIVSEEQRQFLQRDRVRSSEAFNSRTYWS